MEGRILNFNTNFAGKSGPAFLAAWVAHDITCAVLAGNPRPMLSGRDVIAHPASEGAHFARHVEGTLLRDALWKRDRSLAIKKKHAATIRFWRHPIDRAEVHGFSLHRCDLTC